MSLSQAFTFHLINYLTSIVCLNHMVQSKTTYWNYIFYYCSFFYIVDSEFLSFNCITLLIVVVLVTFEILVVLSQSFVQILLISVAQVDMDLLRQLQPLAG